MCALRGMCYNKVRNCNKMVRNFGVQILRILCNLPAVGANGAESA